jgi:hypothetical protein
MCRSNSTKSLTYTTDTASSDTTTSFILAVTTNNTTTTEVHNTTRSRVITPTASFSETEESNKCDENDDEVKYLGMHLDGRPTWAKHMKTKRIQPNMKVKEEDEHYQ